MFDYSVDLSTRSGCGKFNRVVALNVSDVVLSCVRVSVFSYPALGPRRAPSAPAPVSDPQRAVPLQMQWNSLLRERRSNYKQASEAK